jgi:ribosome maturation factor RimP
MDVEDVMLTNVGRRESLTIVVDRDGGVDLDLIAEVSSEISAVLDESPSLFPGAYVVEVTSPGVDRPLTEPRHWRRAIGRLVAVQQGATEPVTGRLLGITADAATLALPDGREVIVSFDSVIRARVEIEFDRKDED